MPFSKYSAKQKKLARVAPPRDKITGADFKAMKKRKKRKKKKMKKELTKRQKTTLAKHKKHHTAKHMAAMKKAMRSGKTFTQAHKMAMKKVGR